MTYYDYNTLRQAAESGKREDIDALGRWLERYGARYWNGECYDADGMELYPLYTPCDEDKTQFEVFGYTTDAQESKDWMIVFCDTLNAPHTEA